MTTGVSTTRPTAFFPRILAPFDATRRHLTPYRAVLCGLVLLAVAAFVVSAVDADFGYGPDELAVWLLVAVGVSGLATYLLAAVFRVPPNSDSWLITGLILFFVVPGGSVDTAVATVATAAVIAAASKYVLAWRRRLILNPAVAGAVGCYALAYAGVDGLSYPFWWVAAEPLLIPMIVIGAAVVTLVREWLLVAVFLVASLVTIGVVELVRGGQDLSTWVVSSPMLFVAAVMLPEPLTSPARQPHRLIYAALVGVLMHCQYTVEVTDSYTLAFVPEIALLVGSLYAFAVRLATRTARRVRLDVETASLADRTYVLRGEPAGGAPSFRAGQWSSVSVPRWSAPVWTGSRRVFSFVSAPREAPVEFGFTVAGVPSSFKAALIDGRARRAWVDEIGGDFVLPRVFPAKGRVVLLASGIGITPFVSMVRSLDGADLSGLTVVHVLRSSERTVYDDELDSARGASARVVTVIAPELADGVDDPDRLAELVGPDIAGAHYYVSGTPGFVERTSSTIRHLDPSTRLRPWRIHTDSFTGY
ncbi:MULTISPECIES: oxidoreductase [Gordonia]|uniref:Putative NADPH oxidoreductase n=2 Tax=Gordonia alkanivorans TaxID=84096 RepID=F9VYD1_9ACTN|nr:MULTISPECIES: oxidoreductase [Gordonia]AZZ83251.1 oxidoreductase [Gordonia alkanivorans]MDH3013357.1 oxidoreductase [Gordonia alkanivorans]MDH3021506.1 oxidoreductase [Gordonia alkanivorans]MDH3025326.1 oxidoreductase [Gordonia alkanivorans]MDH3051036.1 oxidoreductase [Gordonia alkanivorans]